MGSMSKQLSYGGLIHKMWSWSRKNQVGESQVQKMVAVYVAEQMLPHGTIVKGGNSFLLRFPVKQTRFSQDLDLMIRSSYQEWEEEYTRLLTKGLAGFTGHLTIRSVFKHGRKHFATPGFIMYPRDVHIRYLGRSFAKLPLDITPQMDNLAPVKGTISVDMRNLISYLGLPVSETALFANPIEQMIDKAATIYYSEPPRSHDLVDLNLLAPNLKQGELLPPRVTDGVIEDVRLRGAQCIMNQKRINEIVSQYTHNGFGPAARARSIIHSINASVQTRLGNKNDSC